MHCQKCLTENSEKRKFCSECGALIAAYCRNCGFANSLTDKYCGGCGINLSEMLMPEKQGASEVQTSGKYSAEDIDELLQEKSEKTGKEEKKKKSGDAEPVSQDFLDSIFDSSGSE